MSISSELSGRFLRPETVRMLQNILKRLTAEGYISANSEKEAAIATYLMNMYFRGLVIEDKLYVFGVMAAKTRFQHSAGEDYSTSAIHLPMCRVLIVEDEYYLAAEVKKMFEDAGATVLGPVSREHEAITLLESEVPDLAIVDLNLGSGIGFEVAEYLQHQGIPICVLSGYRRSHLAHVPTTMQNVPWMDKPLRREALLRLAARVLA